MNGFIPVDNWDEALEIIDRSRRAADQVTEKWQWEDIVPGCYIVRIAQGLVIFSEIEHDYAEPNMQGFVFGAHYSTVCPLGELGDVHRFCHHQGTVRERQGQKLGRRDQLQVRGALSPPSLFTIVNSSRNVWAPPCGHSAPSRFIGTYYARFQQRSMCEHLNLSLVVHEEGVCDFDKVKREFKGKADPTGFFYNTRGFCKDCQIEFTPKEIMFLTGLPKSRVVKSRTYTKFDVRCSGICETCVEFLC